MTTTVKSLVLQSLVAWMNEDFYQRYPKIIRMCRFLPGDLKTYAPVIPSMLLMKSDNLDYPFPSVLLEQLTPALNYLLSVCQNKFDLTKKKNRFMVTPSVFSRIGSTAHRDETQNDLQDLLDQGFIMEPL